MSVLIPKVYESFPKLRGLPAEACERLQRRALARRRTGVMIEGIIAGVAVGGPCAAGALLLAGVVLSRLAAPSGGMLAVLGVFALLGGIGGGLVGFRFVVAQALAVELATILAPSNGLCNQCGYPLGGLPLEAETLRCPECGLQQRPPQRVDEIAVQEERTP